jgi:anti-anti-sigma factor
VSLADVQVTLSASALVAYVTGEVDMSNAEALARTIIEATPNEAEGVVLDLSDVDYLDSAGIYLVHGIRTSLQTRGQLLVLVIPTPSPVHDALRLAGIQRPGEMAQTVEEGLHALASGHPER